MHDAFDVLRHAAGRSGVQQREVERLLDSFRSDRPSQDVHTKITWDHPRAVILRAAMRLLTEQGFDTGKGVDPERHFVHGRIQRDLTGVPWLAAFTTSRRDWRLSFDVTVNVSDNGETTVTTSRRFPEWIERFTALMAERLAATDAEALERSRLLQNAARSSGPTVLAPGEPLTKPFRGTLRDYSGCATRNDVADLMAAAGGRLPLGRQLFVRADGSVDKGPALFLAPNRHSGALHEHRGTLICAPQGSGKTEFLVRWAKVANAAGYNLFMVDVKGNMRRHLDVDGTWRGEIVHLTTDPRRAPDDGRLPPCHATNFLERLDPWSKVGQQQIRQLAEALLPADSADDGDMKASKAIWTDWLDTFIHFVLIDELYNPLPGRRVDLGDVYELASDEGVLCRCIQRIAAKEAEALAAGKTVPRPRLRDLFAEIAVLLPPVVIVPGTGETGDVEDVVPAGHGDIQALLPLFVDETGPLVGRRAQHTYRWLTENLVSVLRPFRCYGLLGDKVSGESHLPHFSFEAVAGLDANLAPAGRQVTVLLSAREQEGDDAKTLLSLAMARLQHALFERMRHTGNPAMRPVLLLLDETRRIRNFKTNEYISYAREAEAGCVVVYQSLEQVGDARQVSELLENVGTQIYLGSLVRSTARHFIDSLPKRHRPTFTLSTAGADGFGGIQVGQETIDYFSTADLHVLPAGDFPALIYLNDQPRRTPILVSLDRRHQQDADTLARKPARQGASTAAS